MKKGNPQQCENKTLIILAAVCIAWFSFVIGTIVGPYEPINRQFKANIQHESSCFWEDERFEQVNISSSIDEKVQRAFFYAPPSGRDAPLLVSLHTWSGDYCQADPLAELAAKNSWAYIHPDFRGPNNSTDACCSDLVIADIDDAIDYALAHADIDEERIHVIGASGGGYAALCFFMKSRHDAREVSAWVPISNLVSWYEFTDAKGFRYQDDILKCTGSTNDALDVAEAERRSPYYWPTPTKKVGSTSLSLYAGNLDGVVGTVPMLQSIRFYNKLLRDLNASGTEHYVQDDEIVHLLEYFKGQEPFSGRIAGRDVLFERSFMNISLVIFSGEHEMLYNYAFSTLED